MKVREVMSIDPACCTRSETAERAASLMRLLDVGVIPVVDDDKNNKLVGIVTDRDLCMHVVADGRDPAAVTLDECMTDELITCSAKDDLERVLALMQKYQIRRIPVVDEKGRIEGIIATADIALNADAACEDIEETLKAISEPDQFAA